MSTLAASRVGLFVGLACTMPAVVWLLPQTLESGVQGAAITRTAVGGLWVAEGVAIAISAASRLGPSRADDAIGLLVLTAVPLPLLALAWLAGALPVATLVTGSGLLLAWAVTVRTLTDVVTRASSAETERLARAALQVGLAAAVWAFRRAWLPWLAL